MKPASKALLLTLALVIFATVAFCQDYLQETDIAPSAQDSFQEGAIAGENDAKGSNLYTLGGCLLGPLGIFAAGMSDPQPDPQKVILLEQTRGIDYASGYTSSFNLKSRKANLTFAAAGCGITAVLVFVEYVGYQILRRQKIPTMSGYSSSFSKESRTKNLIYAAAGFGSNFVTVAIMAPVVYYGVYGLAAVWASAFE